jgi:5-methylcytosine-specific restriction endonuclease McrA
LRERYPSLIVQRKQPGRRGYDATWDKLRAAFVVANPVCQRCWRVPTEIVHHIKPIDQYPELRLDWDNLQSLCRKCHGDVHAELEKAK